MAKKKRFCQVRQDLRNQNLSVPIGEGFYGGSDRLECRWNIERVEIWYQRKKHVLSGDETFEVFFEGKWQKAESTDFQIV